MYGDRSKNPSHFTQVKSLYVYGLEFAKLILNQRDFVELF